MQALVERIHRGLSQESATRPVPSVGLAALLAFRDELPEIAPGKDGHKVGDLTLQRDS